MLQYRVAAEGGVRDVDEGKRQVLVTFPWERIDTYNTDFARDCFDEYLTSKLPVMCWQHDRKEPIGRATEWQKTGSANEFVAQFSDFDAVPRSRQAFAQIRDKEITDFSYAFDQAEAKPHPSGERGQVRFVRAGMPEFSPVTNGSIPGAIAIGVRSVDVAALRSMVDDKMVSPEEARAILGLDVPIIGETADEPEPAAVVQERERIVVTVGAGDPATIELPEGDRSVTLVINDDGTVSAAGYSMDGAQADGDSTTVDADPDADAGQLASAIDAALDAYSGLMDGVDTTELPAQVQQALALADAAGVAADELLDAMGLPDPDEDGDRAAAKGDPVTVGKKSGKVKRVMPNGALLVDWGDGKSSIVSASDAEEADGARATEPELDPAAISIAEDANDDEGERAPGDPKAANTASTTGTYADPGYQKDGKKRYPLDDKGEAKAAWSYINQSDNAEKYSAEDLAKVKKTIVAACKKFGVDISDDSNRDVEPDLDMTRAALDLLATR